MDELKKHVERIVRPIRASESRKNKMREELLRHLSESAAHAEDDVAVTIEKLGAPETVRAELQASVPAWERFLCLPIPWSGVSDALFEKADNETSFRHAWVRAGYTAIWLALAFAAFLLAAAFGFAPKGLRTDHDLTWYRTLAIPLIVVACGFASVIAYYVADRTGLRAVLSRKDRAPAWKKAAAIYAFCALEITLMIAFVLAPLSLYKYGVTIPGDAIERVRTLFVEGGVLNILLAVMAASVPLSLFIGWAMTLEHRQYDDWGRIEIDE